MDRQHCKTHNIDYYYFCPECAEDRKREQKERDTKQQERKRKWDEMIGNIIWLPEVANPALLGVKMFLADYIHKINAPYDYNEHNCSQFAKEVQDAATKQGIRCGYVSISFTNREIEHAIIAFETDSGLKFFEPQSGEEQDVIIGRCYSATAKGFSDNDIVDKIEISWNDGTKTVFDNSR
jgi:hypothetical protein